MNNTDSTEIAGSKTGVIVRITSLFLIIATIITLIILAMPKTTDVVYEIWDERTTLGDTKAKNHYIMLTDIMCPYCDYFSRAIMSHQEEFEQYLKDNDIVYEMRITDFLNEYGEAGAKSEQAAEATLCATEENKFWDYYHNAMKSLDEDYHSKGIGNAKTSPHITGMTADYWLEVGYEVGLGESFKDCYKNHKMLDKVRENTENAAKVMQKTGETGGMPYFILNKFVTSGFDTSFGWNEVKNYYLDIGLNYKN